MSLTVRVWWPDGRYDAATLDPAQPEWPPSPGRLFAALRAGARSEEGLAALTWLETQPPPLIFAEDVPLSRHRLEGYVVINGIAPAGGNLTHPGRTNGLRTRSGTYPADPRVVFVWPQAEPTPGALGALDRLAADVPYFGRSTSAAVLSVDESGVLDAPSWQPTEIGRGVQLAVPYPGFSDELNDAFRSGGRAWERYRSRDYRYLDPEASAASAERAGPSASPYGPPLVLRLPAGSAVPGTAVGLVTTALRKAVMSLVPEPLPPELSGHGADHRPHVAFLGLLDVGHRHADGHVVAVAISSPASSPEIGDLIASSILGDEPDAPILQFLEIPRIGRFRLSYEPTAERPRAARGDRWSVPSRVWTTATPLLLDQHARRGLTLEEIVASGAAVAGYPRPYDVELSINAFQWGGLFFRPNLIPRKPGDRRLYRHARLTFAQEVCGPVTVGALRHLGFGLCTPETSAQRGAA